MQELRALVRRWNLHHKRNFWRENPSKDDVVSALNRHIRHMKVVHDNIENKKAERREADRKRQVQNTPGEGNNPPRMASLKVRPPLENTSESCLYSDGVALRGLPRQVDSTSPADCVETGIIYMSRWGQDGTNSGEEPASGGTEQAAIQEDFGRRSVSPQLTETRDRRDTGDPLGSKNAASKMQAQRKCSLALLNMTMRDQVLNHRPLARVDGRYVRVVSVFVRLHCAQFASHSVWCRVYFRLRCDADEQGVPRRVWSTPAAARDYAFQAGRRRATHGPGMRDEHLERRIQDQ